jgi:uncharacterized damage-inducible protein DinB
MNPGLAANLQRHWQMLRGRTYDLLDHLSDADLDRRLPFPASQTIAYQLWCMLGSQESWIDYLRVGALEHWSCSLAGTPRADLSVDLFRQRFQAADQRLAAALHEADLLQPYANGLTPLLVHQMLVEHEAHHHGQLINFIYALDLPIPSSWAEQWALSREPVPGQ